MINMRTGSILFLSFILLLICSCSCAASAKGQDGLLNCLNKRYQNSFKYIYTPKNSSYNSVLRFSIRNPRFGSKSTPKPLVIIIPEHESQIPPAIYCAQQNAVQIRTRSGGHDFEGLSYVSKAPFVIIDMIKLSEIKVDDKKKTAWVGAGATIGSLYYRIAEASQILGFPAGFCPTVGVGGHFSGGGCGTLLRKYGLSADNVVDARIVDVNGRIHDRKSMGEDLFWAIRGGGGASFGVIVSWKVQLVNVPGRVTVFKIQRTLEQNATQLVHRWQYIAPRFNRDLFVEIMVGRSQNGRKTTIGATFISLFLGGIDRLLPLMQQSFPELGLVREDCTEMRWIQSILYIAGFPIESLGNLLNRTQPDLKSFKVKQDYVQKPIPESGLEGLWKQFLEPEAEDAQLLMIPYGGRMGEIRESAIPFPHRAGNLYHMSYMVFWQEGRVQNPGKYISWARRVSSYMTPYVSRSPRAAYLNYRDLDIGVNINDGKVSYEQASVWGVKYFKNNFVRLVQVKTVVDPKNFFCNEQSIPTLH